MRGHLKVAYLVKRSVLGPGTVLFLIVFIWSSSITTFSQEIPPPPGPPKAVKIPAIKESKLKNDLRIAVAEKHSVPIVTVQLLIQSGASSESMEKAGLADMTASMLTKGTKSRTAEQIAEEVEFLGGSINSGAGWNNSAITISVTSDKLEKALDILADVALNPSFNKDELELLRSQTLDGLKFNLTQPGFLANYVASVYSFNEHPAGGTPQSVEGISKDDISAFYAKHYTPENAVLLFSGDVTLNTATEISEKLFGKWPKPDSGSGSGSGQGDGHSGPKQIVRRVLVIDLPNSGQAAVSYFKPIRGVGRGSSAYFTASVLNSLLGGGYSSRLNQEIRIKRGLSYGAGSGFAWRYGSSNFSTRTQTKTVSAAEVAELVIGELKRLADTTASGDELSPRKAVLTGNFDRSIETTGGLAGALADLYSFGLSADQLNSYSTNVANISPDDVKKFADLNFVDGDMVIVGDYAVFKDDLAKRFPSMKVDVIKVSDLDITSPNLRKK